MAITNIVTEVATDNLTIGASGNNRIVVALLSQERSPTNINNIQFDGVAGTLATLDDTGTVAAAVYYWLDTDLPASAGTYAFSHGNLVVSSLIYAEGVAQAVPVQTKGLADLETPVGTSPDINRTALLDSASVGSLCVYASNVNNLASNTVITGVTELRTGAKDRSGYSTTVLEVGHNNALVPRAFAAAAFSVAAPSYTITSIDGDNDVQAGQPNVDIIMTATTGVTSVALGGETLTINGVT